MTAELAVSIDAKDVEKFIRSAPAKVERILEKVIYKASLLVERYSKQQTPVDTGRLRASISTSFSPLRATVEPHTNYAVFVHNGTKFMKPRPFMARAKESVDKMIPELVKEELKGLQ